MPSGAIWGTIFHNAQEQDVAIYSTLKIQPRYEVKIISYNDLKSIESDFISQHRAAKRTLELQHYHCVINFEESSQFMIIL